MKKHKIFLLSNREEDYNLLIKYGYKNILWFKSSPQVLAYFSNNPDMFETIDLAFVKSNFYEGNNSEKIYEKIYKNIFLNSIPYIEIDNHKYMLLTRLVARNSLSEKDVFTIISSFKFEEKNVSESIISKDNKDLKVMFIGKKEMFPFVESYFNKQGFGEIKCYEESNYHDETYLKSILSSDIVISGINDYLTDFSEEFAECLNGESSFIYLANFNLISGNNVNISQLNISDTSSKELNRKTIYTHRDYNKLYQYTLDVLMEEYSKFNKAITLKNNKSFNEILKEYMKHREEFEKETDGIREMLTIVDEIDHLSRRIMKKRMKRDNIRDIGGLRFERLEDGISVAFLYEKFILARITFYNDGINLRSPYYKEFNLEVQNSKGYLINLGMKSVYDDRRGLRSDAYPIVRDDDFIKIEGIYKKINTYLEEKQKKKILTIKQK